MPEIVRTLVGLASSQLVILLAIDVGLSLDVREVGREIKNPVLWRTLMVALLGVPMLAILAAVVLPIDPVVRAVLVLMSVSPGAPMLINKARGDEGNLPLAVAIAVALTIAALVTLPIELYVLNILFPLHLHASVPALLRGLVPRLLVPLALGAALRQAWPKPARMLARVARVPFVLPYAVASKRRLARSRA